MPHLTIHAQLTVMTTSSTVYLAMSDFGETSQNAALGSFVYAMPDRTSSRTAICTDLCTHAPSIDFATRLSKILALRTKAPVYVGCSVSLTGMTTEEELELLREVVKQIMASHEAQSKK